jgi:hypothetical protein
MELKRIERKQDVPVGMHWIDSGYVPVVFNELGYEISSSMQENKILIELKNKKTKLRGRSPQANYTDRATAAVGEVVPTFAGRGCCVVRATNPQDR